MMQAMVRLCFVLVCLALGVAQVGTGAWAQDSTATATWTRLPGTAVDISINSDGQAYAVAPDGTPWRWDAVEQRWRKMSGDFVRITAAEGNRPWAIDAKGVVFRYNGLWWENKDTEVADVAADALGNVYIAKLSGEIKKWNPLRSEWRPLDGPALAHRIALDMAGNPWTVGRDGRIRAFDGKQWTALPGRGVDIAVGGDDTVVIADADGRVRTWNAVQRRWLVVAGVEEVTAVAVAPDGGPWAVIKDGVIMATTLLVSPDKIKKEEGKAEEIHAPLVVAPVASATVASAPVAMASNVQATPATPSVSVAPPAQPQSVVAPTQPAQPVTAPTLTAASGPGAQGPSTVAPGSGAPGSTDPLAMTFQGEIIFVNTRKSASVLAIGTDGSVFGLDAGGNVLRWSNTRKRFESFPGTLVRIAVDAAGNPWGISTLGRVFRHTGNLWKQIPNATGSDIAIGADGTVIITDASSNLYKLNAAMTRFERILGRGLLVAVAPDGTPWTVRSDGLVQHCADSPCKVYAQKAKSIAAGSDGSVYVVSDHDMLMRLVPDAKTFKAVRTPGHTPLRVAVGPNGYPWVVTTETLALASNYFERDEAGDRTVAAATGGDTAGSGDTAAVVDVPSATAFTFSKNMSFDTYSITMDSLSSIHAGENGKVYVRGSTDVGQLTEQRIEVFNSTTKKFEDADLSFPAKVQSLEAASDGTIWGFKSSGGSVYKLSSTGTLLKTYTVASGIPRDLVISEDGTVYIVAGTTLYRLKPGTNLFTKFNNDDARAVAVGRAGDLWILDSNYVVQQYTGAKFENRPLGQSVKANDIGASSAGSVYIAEQSDNVLKKWNATNKSFDTVKNTNTDTLDVDENGRPWVGHTSGDTTDVKRGKD